MHGRIIWASEEVEMPVRYRSEDEDSARWDGFVFRTGDIVVSTRSKHGTTWMQTILLLLIHGLPPFPGSLGELSPWLDHCIEPVYDVVTRLERQRHRRVVKTHTPLDGIPLDPRATYIVVARDPLDAAVSLYHQGDNLDRRLLLELTGAPLPTGPRPPVEEWLAGWVRDEADPAEQLDSVAGVAHHLADAWQHRHDDNVVLVHFDDLKRDLGAEIRRIAGRLGIQPQASWDDLVAAASLDAMRERADELAPNAMGVLRDPRAFFRQGRSGTGAALLSEEDLAFYRRRMEDLMPADLLAWLHR